MARRGAKKDMKQHATKEIILELLREGGTLLISAIKAGQELRHLRVLRDPLPSWEAYYPSSVNRQLNRLWRKGYVDIRETTEGYVVTISDRGKTEVLRYDLNTMAIPAQTQWDGKWRMVIFDIPGSEETVRSAFRNHLKSLGFYQMQKSVYVYPYPCDEQIHYLREVYNIPHSVKIATISELENDEDLRKIFHL